jgi:hypothetical protein
MQIGVHSFGAVISDPAIGLTISPVQRMSNLLDEIILAEQVGLDVFGIGEHHRSEFVDPAPVVPSTLIDQLRRLNDARNALPAQLEQLRKQCKGRVVAGFPLNS